MRPFELNVKFILAAMDIIDSLVLLTNGDIETVDSLLTLNAL